MLPQDIITVLPKNNEIKKYEDKKYNNFKLYLNDLNHKVISRMFKDNNDDNKKNIYLNVNKTTNIFDYYLK